MIHLHGRSHFVGEAFEAQRVGLKRTPRVWEVYFGAHLSGTLGAVQTTGIHAVRYKVNCKSTARSTPSQT